MIFHQAFGVFQLAGFYGIDELQMLMRRAAVGAGHDVERVPMNVAALAAGSARPLARAVAPRLKVESFIVKSFMVGVVG